MINSCRTLQYLFLGDVRFQGLDLHIPGLHDSSLENQLGQRMYNLEDLRMISICISSVLI